MSTFTGQVAERRARLHRYYIPGRHLEGWADVVIGADGFFATVSDYGNYAFRWASFGDGDFREFFVDLGPDYVRSKLDSSREFDGHATEKAVKETILEMRRAGSRRLSADDARVAWDAIEGVDTEIAFSDWLDTYGRYIDEAWELACYSPPAAILAFCERALPRIQRAIRDELAAEAPRLEAAP